MSNNIRAELFFLKQFGFSSKLLDMIYLHSESPLQVIFSDNKLLYKRFKFSRKDVELSKYFEQYLEFKHELFLNEDILRKNENNKLYFKYDENIVSELIPLEKRPLFMYCKGNNDLLNSRYKRVAIVGTRNPSEKSIQVTSQIVKKYVDNNFTVVSGLAEGIDTVTHKSTLMNKGRTIAVLPTNFSEIYPKSNRYLVDEILESGLLMTSIGPREHTYKSSFLDRNTYVANISDIIIVIETNLNSGTMNTIRKASDANKEILYIEQEDTEVNEKIKSYGGVILNYDQ